MTQPIAYESFVLNCTGDPRKLARGVLYRVADLLPESLRIGIEWQPKFRSESSIPRDNRLIMAYWNGERRPPRSGELYIEKSRDGGSDYVARVAAQDIAAVKPIAGIAYVKEVVAYVVTPVENRPHFQSRV